MKHEPAPRTHSPDEPPATVIHHYEEDQTLLARWLSRAASKGPSFWILTVGCVAVVAAVGYFVNSLLATPSQASEGWQEMILASSTEDFQRLAETQSTSPVGPWAALQAASARYRDAVSRLPNERDAAAPILTQALEGFREVEKHAKADEPMLRRLAMMGVARTLETSDDLPGAIAEYEAIAKEWPDSSDGKGAAKRVSTLKDPKVIAFYKKFETYKARPGETTIGPRGTNRFEMPPGHPPVDGAIMPAPSLLDGVRAGAIETGELPRNVFQRSGAERRAEQAAPPRDESLPEVFPKDEPKAPTLPFPKGGFGTPK